MSDELSNRSYIQTLRLLSTDHQWVINEACYDVVLDPEMSASYPGQRQAIAISLPAGVRANLDGVFWRYLEASNRISDDYTVAYLVNLVLPNIATFSDCCVVKICFLLRCH